MKPQNKKSKCCNAEIKREGRYGGDKTFEYCKKCHRRQDLLPKDFMPKPQNKKLNKDWEKEFDERFPAKIKKSNIVPLGKRVVIEINPFVIKQFIHSLLKAQKEELQFPMGVSQWREHGKKYGYWKFFERETLQALKKEAEGMKKKVAKDIKIEYETKDIQRLVKWAEKCGFNQALSQVIKLIGNLTGESQKGEKYE